MPWSVAAAAVGAAGALGSGAMGKSASGKAAAQQAAAQQKAFEYQKQVHDTASQQFAPFIEGGTNALGALGQLFGINIPGTGYTGNALDTYKAYTQTPFYQFPLQQGIQAQDRSATARGLALSPGQAAAVNAWGQDYASKNFSGYIGQLANLAGIANQSIGTLSGQGNTAAGNVLTAQSGIGTAQASGTVGGTNALTDALKQAGGLIGGGLKQYGSSYGADSTGSTTDWGNDYASYAAANPTQTGSWWTTGQPVAQPDYTALATSWPTGGSGSGP